MKKKTPEKAIEVHEGSGNVFVDIGLSPDMLVKAELTRQLEKRIKALGLSQNQAAERLGIEQPDVCRLMNGRFIGFTTDRLLGLLNALSVDVRIELRPRGKTARSVSRGSVKVFAVAA